MVSRCHVLGELRLPSQQSSFFLQNNTTITCEWRVLNEYFPNNEPLKSFQTQRFAASYTLRKTNSRHKQKFVLLAICEGQRIFQFHCYVYTRPLATSRKNIIVLMSQVKGCMDANTKRASSSDRNLYLACILLIEVEPIPAIEKGGAK